MVQLQQAFVYALDVPAAKVGTLEGGDARYGCCHQTEEQGHAASCGPETRVKHIEAALGRTGIGFTRVTHREEVLSRLAAKEVNAEDRARLAEFLNLAPGIDPHDDDEAVVDMLAPFAALIHTCVDERDRRASMDKQPGDVGLEGYESPEMRKYGYPEPTTSGRVSCAGPNESNAPKGPATDEERRFAETLHEVVTEPTVLEELRTAHASIQHALFRLGGTRD